MKTRYLSPELISSIEAKLAILNKNRPLSTSLVKKLQEQFKIDMTYNSNAIEGNGLTLKETYLVVTEGLTIKNKSLKDHLEAKNHYEALDFIYDLIERNKPQTFSEITIRNIHQIVTAETEREWAGKYRTGNVIITGADHTPPEAIEVSKLMSDLIDFVRKNQKKLHPIELAALVHHKLVNIHPFFDGNGRTARLVMNILLMQKSYPLTIILKNDRKKYYDTLALADKNQPQAFVRFIAQNVERSLNLYLKILVSNQKDSLEHFMLLSAIAKQTPYNAKYLNLLLRTGKLQGFKEKRNWMTSVEAVKKYMEKRERKK